MHNHAFVRVALAVLNLDVSFIRASSAVASFKGQSARFWVKAQGCVQLTIISKMEKQKGVKQKRQQR